MNSRRIFLAAATAAAVAGLLACQGNPATNASPSPAAGGSTGGAAAMTANVEMKGTQFVPATVTVKKGGTVTWRNMDTLQHNVAPVDGKAFTATQLIGKDATVSVKFDTVGTVDYQCDPHKSSMKGKVVVVE